jgi:hypothetical protein
MMYAQSQGAAREVLLPGTRHPDNGSYKSIVQSLVAVHYATTGPLDHQRHLPHPHAKIACFRLTQGRHPVPHKERMSPEAFIMQAKKQSNKAVSMRSTRRPKEECDSKNVALSTRVRDPYTFKTRKSGSPA